MAMGFPPRPPFRSQIPHWGERVVTYCAKVLPIVFDNSLSYYEFLGHIQVKLNEVIKALNSQNLVFVEFTHMIELELQNFESYMEERQTNFEEQMQQEWEVFKTELRAEWAAFKEGLRAEWEAEKELNEQFRTDMQEAFENFQTLITTQQQQFETLITNQQNQFQADMTSRQNNFESTMEDEFEQWKVDTLDALQQGIQQFEQDAMEALRAALPGMIEEAIPETIAPAIAAEVGNQDFARITDISNPSAGSPLNLSTYDIALFQDDVLVDDTLTLADLSNIEIKPNTTIMIKSDANEVGEFCRVAGSARVKTGDSTFPTSGYSVSVGYYTTDNNVLTVFESENYQEITHANVEDVTRQLYVNLTQTFWESEYRSNHYFTVRFLADEGTASFFADYSQGIEAMSPPTANVIFQDERTGQKVTVPKPSVITVDQVYVAASANPQSGTAVADALASLPTVDQTYTPASTNAQSGTAVKQAMDTVPDTIKNSVQAQRFVSLAAVENEDSGITAGFDISNFPVQVFEGSTLVDTTTFSQLTNLTIKPNTTLIFPYTYGTNTLVNIYWLANAVYTAYQKSDYPASGYTVSTGYYTLTAQTFTEFDETYYRQLDSHAVTNGTTQRQVVALSPIPWYAQRQEIYSLTIRFLADAAEPSFTCDFTDALIATIPPKADLTLQDGMTGAKFRVPKQIVDYYYNATSRNAQSGVAVAQAIAAIPSVTVDQTFDNDSTNAQSGAAITNAPIVPHWEAGTSWSTGSASHSQTFNIFKDFPVGTLFLVKFYVTVANTTYYLQDITPLSDASDSDYFYPVSNGAWMRTTAMNTLSNSNPNHVLGWYLKKTANPNFLEIGGVTGGSTTAVISINISAIGVDQM